MAESKYSVTLTGRIRSGRDAPKVWERVAQLLKLDAPTFRERVLSRLPVTLKAVDYEDARRQQEALTSGGAHALVLPEDQAPRVWIRRERTTRGPLSMTYARHALRERILAPDVSACLQGSKEWQPLESLVRQHAPPAMAPRPAPSAAAMPGPEQAPEPRIRTGLPGWSLGLIVVVISVALLGLLAALVALPAYRVHEVRAHVVQGLALAERPKAAVLDYVRTHGRPPADNAAAGLPAARDIHGAYVDAVDVDQGEVAVHFGAAAGPQLKGRQVLLSPLLRHGSVSWACSSPDLPAAYLPPACR